MRSKERRLSPVPRGEIEAVARRLSEGPPWTGRQAAISRNVLFTTGVYGSGEEPVETAYHWKLGAASGMGGLYSSVDDMARFMAFQLSSWPPSNTANNAPVRRSTVRESHLVGGTALPTKRVNGIGWSLRNDSAMGHRAQHNGGTHLYSSAVVLLLERDVGVVALANVGNSSVDALVAGCARILAGQISAR